MPLLPNPELNITVLLEDPALLVVNKPSGLPVYPLRPTELNTVVNGLVARYRELEGIGPYLQGGAVHRLDNLTSGLLVVARQNDVLKKLRERWNSDEVIKEYTALVVGRIPMRLTLTSKIAHHPTKKKKMMVCETEVKSKKYKARPASSEVERLEYFDLQKTHFKTLPQVRKAGDAGRYSLVKVRIKTGLRHQIRVHLASIGNPIAGDTLYQNANKRAHDKLGLKRPFLHLSRLVFKHPLTKKRINVESPLARDLKDVLDKMRGM